MANATRSVSEHQIRILLDEMDEIKKLISFLYNTKCKEA